MDCDYYFICLETNFDLWPSHCCALDRYNGLFHHAKLVLVTSWSELFSSSGTRRWEVAARQGSVAKYTCNPGKTLWHHWAKSRCWYFSAAPAGRRPAGRRDPCLRSQRRHGRIRATSPTRLPPNPTIWGKQPTRWGNVPVWDTSGSPSGPLWSRIRLHPPATSAVCRTAARALTSTALSSGGTSYTLTAGQQMRRLFSLNVIEGSTSCKKNCFWKFKQCLWFFWRS